jgi:hypothetical protein
MTTPITIHLTDEEIAAVRRSDSWANPSADDPKLWAVCGKVYNALPEPPRPLQPGDPVDIARVDGWTHNGRYYVGPLKNGKVVIYSPEIDTTNTRPAHAVRHHQHDTP